MKQFQPCIQKYETQIETPKSLCNVCNANIRNLHLYKYHKLWRQITCQIKLLSLPYLLSTLTSLSKVQELIIRLIEGLLTDNWASGGGWYWWQGWWSSWGSGSWSWEIICKHKSYYCDIQRWNLGFFLTASPQLDSIHNVVIELELSFFF